MIRNGKADQVGEQAEVFVSHAWRYRLQDVISALENYLSKSGQDDAFIWFDGLVVNQHKTHERDFSWWASTFQDAIKRKSY